MSRKSAIFFFVRTSTLMFGMRFSMWVTMSFFNNGSSLNSSVSNSFEKIFKISLLSGLFFMISMSFKPMVLCKLRPLLQKTGRVASMTYLRTTWILISCNGLSCGASSNATSVGTRASWSDSCFFMRMIDSRNTPKVWFISGSVAGLKYAMRNRDMISRV